MRARTAAATALAVLAAGPAALAAVADPTVVADPDVLHLDARDGSLLYTHRDNDDQYRALVRVGTAVPRELSPQSSEAFEPRLGSSGGHAVVSYRRCSDDGKCGLYRLDLVDGKETPIATSPPSGCVDDHPVVTGSRVVFGRTCTAGGDGVYTLKGTRRRRILRLDGATVGPVGTDGSKVAAVSYASGAAALHVVGLGGGGAFTVFRSTASAAGVDDRLTAPTIRSGRVTWGWVGEGEHVTVGMIFRAAATKGAACTRERRELSTDSSQGTVAGELTGVATDGTTLYYGVAQRGVLRAVSPAFAARGSDATASLGRGCDFRG
jgi:hypothetical protein